MRRIIIGLLLALVLSGCSRPQVTPAPVEVVVAAAASLADALKELQPGFEAQQQGVRLRFTFGSSGALGQQIEQGAPIDLFLSAATEPMDRLVQKGLVDPSAVAVLATNELVLIQARTGAAPLAGWTDLARADVQRVAIGNPAHVPAGQYARTALTQAGLWSAVEKKAVLGEDVRQVLTFVESGEVQAGIVYRTDAATSQKVTVIAAAPAGSHPPVVYPMAVLKEAKHPAQARALAAYLSSAAGRQVLSKYGFGAP